MLIYDNSYFGNEIVSAIVRWLFIAVGTLALTLEASKIVKGNIKGVGNFLIGVFLFSVWFILYFLLSLWIVNTVAFFFLVFGAYGIFRGLFEIVYSMRQLVKSDKKKKSSAVTDVLLLITTIFGLILVAIQILEQIKVIPI